MCTGRSAEESDIIIQFENSRREHIISTEHGERITLMFCIIVQTLEFGIYLCFFLLRFKNDNGNIAKILTQEETHRRNLKNVGTFLGQFYGFVVEYTFLISLLFIHSVAEDDTQQLKALVVVTKFIDFGLLSVVEVFSSPSLRSFMKN